MKALKIAAIVCALALTASLCGCDIMGENSSLSSRVDSSLQSSDGALESILDLSEPMDDLISDIESGISDIEDEIMGEDESSIPEEEFSSEASAAMSTDFNEIGALDSTSNGWGPGVNRGEDGRPLAPVSFQEKFSKYAVDFIRPEKGVIYLTFDEGYENGYTPKILDVLKEKEVSAVFFVTLSYAKNNPDLIKRMIDEGHIVGNHSSTHPDMTALSLQEAFDDIKKLHDYMLDNHNYKMTLFRFPMGCYSEQTLALVESMGYRSVFWSFAYKDWETDNQPNETEAYNRITNFAHDGAIYLLHAVS
ncbi:MAG: polysaccharide deacetylase family protein, partial [Oscillospiraceae bacterium]|nr:polysaccharide deacetylase family protein [Oscillospiraceae bacterium]